MRQRIHGGRGHTVSGPQRSGPTPIGHSLRGFFGAVPSLDRLPGRGAHRGNAEVRTVGLLPEAWPGCVQLAQDASPGGGTSPQKSGEGPCGGGASSRGSPRYSEDRPCNSAPLDERTRLGTRTTGEAAGGHRRCRRSRSQLRARDATGATLAARGPQCRHTRCLACRAPAATGPAARVAPNSAACTLPSIGGIPVVPGTGVALFRTAAPPIPMASGARATSFRTRLVDGQRQPPSFQRLATIGVPCGEGALAAPRRRHGCPGSGRLAAQNVIANAQHLGYQGRWGLWHFTKRDHSFESRACIGSSPWTTRCVESWRDQHGRGL